VIRLHNIILYFLTQYQIIVQMIAGKIIHIGDGMVCYSPETSNHDKKSAFRNVINCEIAMMAAFDLSTLEGMKWISQMLAIEIVQITEYSPSQNR
jgi:hypothetical protein